MNFEAQDKINLSSHRLLPLGEKKAAMISECNGGWCIADIDDYLQIRDFFSQGEIVFDNNLGEKKISLINALWNCNLLEKNGSSLSDLIQPCAPILLVLKITGNCNFNCAYCYDHSEARVNKVIPLDKVKETISSLLAKNRMISIIPHGGEPLLHFPLIKEIVEFAVKEAGGMDRLRFSIQTNGSLFNKEVVSFLDKYNFSVGLSLDGMTEHANGHRVVKQGASCLEIFNRNMKEYGGFLKRRAGVICTLSKRNIEEVPSFILWLQDLGIRGVSLSPLFAAGKGKQVEHDIVSPEEYIELLSLLVNMVKNKKIEHISVDSINKFINSLTNLHMNDLCHAGPCGASNNFLVIDAEGNYRACDCFYHDYFLLESNDSRCILDKRAKILSRTDYMKNNACADCAIFGLCGGGCLAEAMMDNGIDKAVPEKSCKVKRFFYKKLLKEYAFDKERPLFSYYSQIMGAKTERRL